jgi:hypothetical protein
VVQEEQSTSDGSDPRQSMKEKSEEFQRDMRIASNSVLSVIGVVERREKHQQLSQQAEGKEASLTSEDPYDDVMTLKKFLPGLLASHWVGNLYLRLLVRPNSLYEQYCKQLNRTGF